MEPQLEDKFIAFVDILGFQSMVNVVEEHDELRLSDLLECCSKLSQLNHVRGILEYGPTICPESRYESRDLRYQVTQVSDCAIVSAEVSPAGVVNLLAHVSACVYALMMKGKMVRGYVTRGNIYHKDNQFIGTGYQHAKSKEKEVKAFRISPNDGSTPFVELDPVVVNYIRKETDKCVREMFMRMCREDDSGIAVVFPFKKLSGLVGGNLMDMEACRQSLYVVRKWIKDFIRKLESQSPSSDSEANKKSKYYRKFLYEQLDACASIEQELYLLNQPAVRLRHEGNI